jgi:gamma-glutamyltranspeptidase / glutathione hydrolase
MRFFTHNFPSRRSVVMCKRGMAASSQPLAVEAAINVLQRGGNAIDAAVTATAVLGVVEPMSTGLGGDCFALLYSTKERRLTGINASGRAPRSASPDTLLGLGVRQIPLDGPLSVTVPGALDGLSRCLTDYGTISLQQALGPAIFYAEDGFPVHEVAAQQWERSTAKLCRNEESSRVYLPKGRAPLPGEVFHNPDLARTLRLIAEQGPDVFYRGTLGEAISIAVRDLGGLICLDDLAAHNSDWVEPIATSYRGYEIAEMPPNTQGLAVLIALNILEGYNLSEMGRDSDAYLHCLIEATKVALADTRIHVADPGEPIETARLLSKLYAEGRRGEISQTRAAISPGTLLASQSDTVYVAVVDEQRNVVSMISSLFKSFGSGITVPGTGLLLQNRGACFSLEPDHPNVLAPCKRPFHTIIPAMIMRDRRPWACFGLVGGLMQAQGHIQVVCNLVDFDMNPQAALDAPRFRVFEDGRLGLEDNIPENVREGLRRKGHLLKQEDSTEEGFGGGQLIIVSEDTLQGASDPRKDGCAIGY